MFRNLAVSLSSALMLGGFALATPATADAAPLVKVGVHVPTVHVRVGVPPRPGPNHVWVAGHWTHDRHGHGHWVSGHWRYQAPKRVVVTKRGHGHGHATVRTVRVR